MKTITSFKKNFVPFIIGAGIFILGCLNPQITYGQFWTVSFDGAPALKPAQLEISPYGAGSYFVSGNNDRTLGYTPGLKIGIGILKNFDVKVSYNRGFYKAFKKKFEVSNVNEISIMPKFSILKGHLAFQMPFTVFLYKSGNDNQKKLRADYYIGPRIIASIHHKKYLEFNMSPFFKLYIPGGATKISTMIGGNIGFAFSSNLERWSVRPEGYINYLFAVEEVIVGWGLAFTFNIDMIKKKE